MCAPRMMDACTECSNWRWLPCSISAASLFKGSSGLGSCSGRSPSQMQTHMHLLCRHAYKYPLYFNRAATCSDTLLHKLQAAISVP